MRSCYTGQVSTEHLDQVVTLFGWVHRRRDHGGVIFIDLRDREGLAQVVCDPDRAEVFAVAERIRNEFCVKVVGKVRRRPEGTANANIRSGQVEVLCQEIEILNPSVTPPFQLDDENLSETTRLTHRVLDLRRAPMQQNLMLRYRVAMEVRKYLDSLGFVDIETPMLTKSTPEGARDYLVPSRVNAGQFFALPQSPQLFKQLLMVAGFDRYYQIARCYRDEDFRADRQPEFTQLDVEMSFVDQDDVIAIAEEVLVALWRLVGHEINTPLPRMTYAEAMARFGSDKPDLRMGQELVDCTAFFADTPFRVFQAPYVGSVVMPGGASQPRKQLDAWQEWAKQRGAKGLAYLLVQDDGTLTGPVAKRAIKSHYFDVAVVGVSGISPEAGLTAESHLNAEILEVMIQNAQWVMVLADHRKFGRARFAKLADLRDVDLIVTDRAPERDMAECLEAAGIEVVVADEAT